MPPSPPLSTRVSMYRGSAALPTPSREDVARRKERLRRSGAFVYSHSIATVPEYQPPVEIVDVGSGKKPTHTEHLLARLEKHGLRRCFCREDPPETYQVEPSVVSEEARRHSLGILENDMVPLADQRESYYYLCVPCELRLTRCSTKSATMRMLEDVHYHFSSVSHRSSARWMADADIDETLDSSPLLQDARDYGRIFVNGLPVLLSRRPGGGHLFYPLPHEQLNLRTLRQEIQQDPQSAMADNPKNSGIDHTIYAAECVPVQGKPRSLLYWYGPVASLWTRSVQYTLSAEAWDADKLPYSQTIGMFPTPRHLYVSHEHPQEYAKNSFIDPVYIPLTPGIVHVRGAHLPKAVLFPEAYKDAAKKDAEFPRKLVHAQAMTLQRPTRLTEVGRRRFQRAAIDLDAYHTKCRIQVCEGECYRLVMLSQSDTHRLKLNHAWALQMQSRQRGDGGASAYQSQRPVVLTQERLHEHILSQGGGEENLMKEDAAMTSEMTAAFTFQSGMPSERGVEETHY